MKVKEYCGVCGILLKQNFLGKNWIEFRERKLCKDCNEDRLAKEYEDKRKEIENENKQTKGDGGENNE